MPFIRQVLIVVTGLLISISAFGQEQDYYCNPPKNQPARQRHLNCLDLQLRRQGLWKFYSGSKLLIQEFNYKDGKQHGQCIWYYSTIGTIRVNANYFDGKRDGEYVANFFNGQTQMEGQYDYGKKVGLWTYYYSTTGEVRCSGQYVMGKMNGPWKYYTSKGQLKKTVEFKLGEAISTTYPEKPSSPTNKPLANPTNPPGGKSSDTPEKK